MHNLYGIVATINPTLIPPSSPEFQENSEFEREPVNWPEIGTTSASEFPSSRIRPGPDLTPTYFVATSGRVMVFDNPGPSSINRKT